MSPRLPAATPVLAVTEIRKTYGGVTALAGVDFDLVPGEVHALLGQNGAGKSTLIKILSGAVAPDSGTLRVDGAPVSFGTPAAALAAGIATVYQDPLVYPELTVTENVFLNRELRDRFGNIDRRAQETRVARLLVDVGVDTKLAKEKIGRLSLARRQLAMIAKALSVEPKVIIFDEPTAILTERESQNLFGIIRGLRERGVGIIYISHRLEEIFTIADRVTVLKDGASKGTRPIALTSVANVIELMAGHALTEGTEHQPPRPAAPLLEVRGISLRGQYEDVSFSLAPGEIVGFFGLVGAGRSEVARAIFGEQSPERGEILLDGKRLALRSPRDATRAGIAYLPEDRKGQGLFGALSVCFNETVTVLPRLSAWRSVTSSSREREVADRYVRELAIKTSDIVRPVATLSGGNQQKVVLAKWLAARPRVFILDEPTAGVDVGAKAEIHRIIVDLAQKENIAIMIISSELPEVLALADRLIVMHEGRITSTFPRGVTAEKALAAAMATEPLHA